MIAISPIFFNYFIGDKGDNACVVCTEVLA